jgi:hypothetical protein
MLHFLIEMFFGTVGLLACWVIYKTGRRWLVAFDFETGRRAYREGLALESGWRPATREGWFAERAGR